MYQKKPFSNVVRALNVQDTECKKQKQNLFIFVMGNKIQNLTRNDNFLQKKCNHENINSHVCKHFTHCNETLQNCKDLKAHKAGVATKVDKCYSLLRRWL